jgi:Secretion system C-terminal sorting domain
MRIFYIMSLFVLIALQTKSQSRALVSPDPESKIVKFFPNPAISQITFNFEKGYDKNYSFQIFNFIGKKVFEAQTISPRTTVDLGDFYRGVYIFQVRDKTGRVVESGKFQVAR